MGNSSETKQAASQELTGVTAFRLVEATIDTSKLASGYEDARSGACVVFEGRVRNTNEGKPVVELEYEAYPRMATAEGERVLAEAVERFSIVRAACVHRLGRLRVGDVAVWVAVLAGHREEAFSACRYIIDEVKARVPIWKKEHYRGGDASWVGGGEASGGGGAVV